MQRKSVLALAIALLLLTIIFIPAFSVTAVFPPIESPLTQSPDEPPSPQIDGALATAVLYPSDDSPVQEGAPTTTAPTSGYLVAGYYQGSNFADGRIRSYLKFDLSSISADSSIVSATLHLKQAGGADYVGQTRTVGFYRVIESWDENTITWNLRPDHENNVGSVTTTYNYQDWVSFDITEQVRNWVTGSQSNHGLVAIGPEGTAGIYRAFFASGYIGQPELHVRYVPAPPPVLDAWPGNLSMRASSTAAESPPTLNVSNVTYGTLNWTASKVGAASWLTLNQTSGSATPSAPGAVGFTVDASGLSPGTYTEQIQISSGTSNVENSPIISTFTLEVLDTLHNIYLPTIMGGSGSSNPDTSKLIALLVGVADYQNINSTPDSASSPDVPDVWPDVLVAPKFDVEDFANLLLNDAAVPAADVTQLVDANAVRQNIMDAFDVVAQKATPNDTVLFYYSGHGGQTPDNNGDEGDGFDEFIAPHDTYFSGTAFEHVITDDDLEAALATIAAGRIVVIIDSCYSGDMMSTATTVSESGDLVRRGLTNPLVPNSVAVEDAMAELIGAGRLIITGGTGDQLTWESSSLNNGVFTYFFLEALQDALHDTNGNGRVSFEEAYWFSRDMIDDWIFANTGEHQNPDINDELWGQVNVTWLP